jgi:hypothetical protein
MVESVAEEDLSGTMGTLTCGLPLSAAGWHAGIPLWVRGGKRAGPALATGPKWRPRPFSSFFLNYFSFSSFLK